MTSGCKRERGYKFGELDAAVVVLVKDVKNERSKGSWVAFGKEALIDLRKLVFGQFAGRAVMEEAIMPVSYLLLREVCFFDKLVHRHLVKLRFVNSHFLL